jgi:hypothetical protein
VFPGRSEAVFPETVDAVEDVEELMVVIVVVEGY